MLSSAFGFVLVPLLVQLCWAVIVSPSDPRSALYVLLLEGKSTTASLRTAEFRQLVIQALSRRRNSRGKGNGVTKSVSSPSFASKRPSPEPSKSSSPAPSASHSSSPVASTTPSVTPSAASSVAASVTPSLSPSASSLAVVATTPTTTPESNVDPLRCDGLRKRKEFRSMTKEERKEWVDTMYEVMTERDANQMTESENLAYLHMLNEDEAHSRSYFLPWNRLFLLRMENILRQKKPRISLPYWDWTLDADDFSKSVIWNKDFLGSQNFQSIKVREPQTFGSLLVFQTGHIAPGSFIQRNFTSTSPDKDEFRRLWGKTALNRLVEDEKWDNFTDTLEEAHLLVHSGIGDAMTKSWAPVDPAFYLVHTFVDYLYFKWQAVHGTKQFGGTHDFSNGIGNQDAKSDRELRAFGKPVSAAFELSCVGYQQTGISQKEDLGRRSTDFDDDPCADKVMTSANFMERDRCRKGEQALQWLYSL